MCDWGSFWRGVRAMRPGKGKVNYGVWRVRGHYSLGSSTALDRFWFHVWTPIVHDGRGPYVSIGLGFVAIGRGY